MDSEAIKPGTLVEVTQQTPHVRRGPELIRTRGRVEKAEQAKTGAWYAHAKDDRLWLDRLTLRREDGELVVLNLDAYSHIEILEEPTSEADASPPSQGSAAQSGGAERPAGRPLSR